MIYKQSYGDFQAVNDYALHRLQSKGDVYGWGPLSDGSQRKAFLLVSQDSPLDSFPAQVEGITLILKPVPAPEAYM